MSFFDGSDDDLYHDAPGHKVPAHWIANVYHRAVSKVIQSFPKNQPAVGGIYKEGSTLDKQAKAAHIPTGTGSNPGTAAHLKGFNLPGTGVASHPSPAAPQHPVSHPGTGKPPIKAATGNRGHATTHPPKPLTGAAHPTRHTRPPHAVGKATGGTQHTNSSGPKAGHPQAHKTAIGHAVSKHLHKVKKHHVKKPKKPKKPKA